MKSELQFLLNTKGRSGRGGVALSPAQYAKLPGAIYQELFTTMHKMGTAINFDLRFRFYKMIKERPRNPDYEGSRETHLWDRMQTAFRHEVEGDDTKITLGVFDVGYVDEQTRDEGYNTHGKGWFMRFADGHDGRRHGGVGWGFAEHDFVMKLAKEAANLIGDAQKRAMWLEEMDIVFRGRHGEGIMVKLDKPMFKILPQFGDASKFIRPHPGYFSWPAIGQVGQEVTRRRGWAADMIQAAFDRAVAKL
jgi:hypothetical protein